MTSPAFDLASLCDATLLGAVRASMADLPAGTPVGVGLSAGADSAMLTLHAAQVARERGLILHGFHIHHGLLAQADGWRVQAHALAALLQISCHSRCVQVNVAGQGIEAAAREARYAALADLAALAGVQHLLLAHHQDDQAETVLLRLLRGAGPLALAAMVPEIQRDGLWYRRPWLLQPRSRMLACARRFAEATGWQPVQDPSNGDVRYARGVLRTELAPILDTRWPAWRQTLARHARQAAELSGWMDETARQEWSQVDVSADGLSFSLLAWRNLPASHQGLLLRHWLRQQGLRMPTEARLQAWLRQLRGVHALGYDRHVRLQHGDAWIVVRRGRVALVRDLAD